MTTAADSSGRFNGAGGDLLQHKSRNSLKKFIPQRYVLLTIKTILIGYYYKMSATYERLIIDGETTTLCPFCKEIIRHKKLPAHTLKCKKHYKTTNLIQCTFSASHYIPAARIKQHEERCPFRPTVEERTTTITKHGDCKLPVYRDPTPSPDEEDWTNECNAPAFIPIDYQHLDKHHDKH